MTAVKIITKLLPARGGSSIRRVEEEEEEEQWAVRPCWHVHFANIFNQSSGLKSDEPRQDCEQRQQQQQQQQQHVLHIQRTRIPICPRAVAVAAVAGEPLTCGNAVLVLVSARSCNAYSMFPDRLADRQFG